MKKEFKFTLKKETLVELTKSQQRRIVGGENTYVGDCDAPKSTDQTDCDACDTILVPTSMMATCSGNPNTHFGCSTAESNCWLTKDCTGQGG